MLRGRGKQSSCAKRRMSVAREPVLWCCAWWSRRSEAAVGSADGRLNGPSESPLRAARNPGGGSVSDDRTRRARKSQFSVHYKHLLLVLTLLTSALMMGAVMGSARLPWFAWVGLLPLLLAIKRLPPIKALVAGGMWGLCIFASSRIAPGGVAKIEPTLLFVGLLVTVPAIYACLGALQTRRFGFNPFLLALGWVGVELTLQPLGLVNGLLAGTHGDSTIAHVVGNVCGYGFVAFLVVLANAALLSIARWPALRRPSFSLRFLSIMHEAGLLAPPSKILLFNSYFFRLPNPRAPPVFADH